MKKIISLILLIISGALTAVGISGGQPAEVFRKAIIVCLECIGIE